jgi:hypothetical protein
MTYHTVIFNTAINHIPALLTHCSQLYNTQLIAQNKTSATMCLITPYVRILDFDFG